MVFHTALLLSKKHNLQKIKAAMDSCSKTTTTKKPDQIPHSKGDTS